MIELVTLATVAIIVVAALVLYLEPSIEFSQSRNSSLILPRVNWNTTRLQGFDPSPVLITEAGALTTIFAIVFGLSQFLISDVGQRYSPKMVVFLRRSRGYWGPLAIYSVSTVFLVSSLTIVHALDPFFNMAIALASTSLFAVAIAALLRYLHFFRIVADPTSFSEVIVKRLTERLNSADELKEGAIALSDAATKAMLRGGEEETTLSFLSSMEKVLEHYLEDRLIPPGTFRRQISDEFLKQFVRVYQEAVNRRETGIAEFISSQLYRIGSILYIRR